MIPGFFLNILYIVLNWAVHLLPEFDIPSAILDAFDLMWSYLVSFSFLTPLGALQGALTLVIVATLFEVGIYIFLGIFHALSGRRVH